MRKCMTANELATEIEFTAIPCLQEAVAMLRQQQAEIDFLKKEILEKHEDWKHEGQQAANARAEIDKVNAEWVQATTALVNAVQEIHGKQAEIEALKAENRVLRKGELWLGMVYNNRGNGIAPMYLENFMHFCETNGFTEESGYKLFKEQEK